jgi:ABC-type nickel/cobalt efflux system permease component RcnA
MRRTLTIIGLIVALGLGALWLSGGFEALKTAILDGQRQAQSALAGAVRAIKGGQPGAVTGLLAVCFAYGFLHAAGPGHGKLVIGGYGMGRRVPMARLTALALLSSLAQAAVAVALVYAVVAVLGLGRQQAEGLAEGIMAPVGLAMVAGVGLWLMARGLKGLRAAGRSHGHDQVHGHDHHAHDHGHHHSDARCDTCGHAHGPSLDEVAHLTGWRDTAALVAGIALRPCSGALFLLILTWQLGIGGAGVLGTFAMGLGTAVVTVAVAAMAVWAREGALASLPGQSAARALPWIEITAGAVVALAALSLLATAL